MVRSCRAMPEESKTVISSSEVRPRSPEASRSPSARSLVWPRRMLSATCWNSPITRDCAGKSQNRLAFSRSAGGISCLPFASAPIAARWVPGRPSPPRTGGPGMASPSRSRRGAAGLLGGTGRHGEVAPGLRPQPPAEIRDSRRRGRRPGPPGSAGHGRGRRTRTGPGSLPPTKRAPRNRAGRGRSRPPHPRRPCGRRSPAPPRSPCRCANLLIEQQDHRVVPGQALGRVAVPERTDLEAAIVGGRSRFDREPVGGVRPWPSTAGNRVVPGETAAISASRAASTAISCVTSAPILPLI